MTAETRGQPLGRPRTAPIIAILAVLIALATAALVIQAATPVTTTRDTVPRTKSEHMLMSTR